MSTEFPTFAPPADLPGSEPSGIDALVETEVRPRRGGKRRAAPHPEPKPAVVAAVKGKSAFNLTIVGKKLSSEDVGETLDDLASMLEAGESEARALQLLADNYKKTNVGGAYSRAADQMSKNGKTIIEAIVAETDVFPQVARELIKAAATPRGLHENLRHAALIIVEGADIKSRIRAALFKPLMTAVLVVAFVLVAAEWLLPGVAQMFSGIGVEVPPATVFMISAGAGVKWVMGGLVVLYLLWLIFWVVTGRRIKRLRIMRDSIAVTMPLLGPISQMSVAARFCDVLAACLASGMSELEALEVAGHACGNEAVEEHMAAHIVLQEVGKAAFSDFAASKLFPWNLKSRLDLSPSPQQTIIVLKEMGKVFHKKSHRRLEKFADRIGPISEIVVLLVASVVILAVALPVTTFVPQMMTMMGGQ